MQRNSLYWDDFHKRAVETSFCLKNGLSVPVRRVAVFITEKCNFRCKYCNVKFTGRTLSQEAFEGVLKKYPEAIIHITGGEPSVVPWLYPFLEANGDKYRFHLNTNGFIKPPAKFVKRLKISLDSSESSWDSLVGRKGAFDRVVQNIKESIPYTVVSVTYTLSKANYTKAVDFARFAKKEFSGLYAVFFSVYKGCNKDFAIDDSVANDFFNNILPELQKELLNESSALLRETLDEKRRLVQGIRFGQDLSKPCYLSMSERVVSPDGTESTCSHLYRDGIMSLRPVKHEKCKYGCNQRLVMFNNEVQEMLIG